MSKRSFFKQFTLYSYRYVIGGVLLSALMVVLLLADLSSAPAGLSPRVMESVVQSSTLSFSELLSQSFVDLPYHMLQALSLTLLGINIYGISLASIVIAFLTAIIFVAMIHRWFRLDIALLSGLLLVTSAPFLTLGRSGEPTIMVLFWLSLILLAATNILHGSKHFKIWQTVAVAAVALSLYTPLMIYPIIALSAAGLLHPHVRYLLRKGNKLKLTSGGIIFLVLISPLIITILTGATDYWKLLGLSGMPTFNSLLQNGIETGKILLGFQSAIIGDLPKPFFVAPILVLAVLGLAKTCLDHYSARAYMLFIWLGLLVVPLLFAPFNMYAIVVPVFIMVAIGLETMIHEWYKLFPRNPYARIGGLIPLSVLILVTMLGGSFQYFYGHFYGTSNTNYHQSLSMTRQLLEEDDQSTLLVTDANYVDFYRLLQADFTYLSVGTKPNPNDPTRLMIVHSDARYHPDIVPSKVLATGDDDEPDIVRLYKLN